MKSTILIEAVNVLSTLEAMLIKILYPFSKGRKQGFERIIYLARSQRANCQNSNSDLKPQAPKSWPPHNAAWTVVQEPWHSEPPVNNWNHSKGMESKFTYEFHSY